MRALSARARAQLEHLPFEPQDVVCVFAGCTHGKGLHFLSTPTLAIGATVLLIREFDPATILCEMKKHGATVTGAAPAYIRSLVEAARRETELPKLRFALSSSDKLPENLPSIWQEIFKSPLLEGGGMTETCGPIFSNRPGDTAVGTIGRPYPGVHVRIVGPDGRDVPDGTGGELWCAGDFLFSEYWNDPEATRRVMVDGWYRTGDQAVRDHDGRYRILGRTGFMIKRGGIFVSPFKVEAALAKHPAIADCLATGMPSEKWGQEVEAFVVLKQTISLAELRAHAVMALGEPSRPVRIWSVDHIPKSSLGKVVRNDLVELRTSAKLLTQ
jgi:acyl-coenzyme A synthetase/AMP-(fatty) acid ligase